MNQRIRTNRAIVQAPARDFVQLLANRWNDQLRMRLPNRLLALLAVCVGLFGAIYTLPSASVAQQPEIVVPQAFVETPPQRQFQPQWVWDKDASPEVRVVQEFLISTELPAKAELQVSVDDEFVAFVNDVQVGSGRDWSKPRRFDAAAHLRAGQNKLRLECKNNGGPAGALAVLRMQFEDGMQLVGTSESSKVFVGGLERNAVRRSPDSAPWNLFKPETDAQRAVREEARRLTSEIQGSDPDLAARSLVYLTYLALESPALDFLQQTFSLFDQEPELTLLQLAMQSLKAHEAPRSGRMRAAALSSIKLLLVKSPKTQEVLEYFASDYCRSCADGESLRLAMLGGLKERIAAEKSAYDSLLADRAKRVEAKRAEIAAKDAEISAKQTEIAALSRRLKLVESQIASNNARKELLTHENRRLQAEIDKLTAVKNQTDEIQSHIHDIKHNFDANKVIIESIGGINASLQQSRTPLIASRLTLERELDDLVEAKRVLSEELAAIRAVSASAASVKRLVVIERFLLDAQACSESLLVRDLLLSVLNDARKLFRQYRGVSAIEEADRSFQASLGGGNEQLDIGASTSAADRPAVSEQFTSSDRAGATHTAPYDPSLRPQARPPYPRTDDKGRRVKTDTSKNVNNVFRKAPGGAGATKPR